MAINKKLITFDKKLTFLGANGINNLSSPVDGYYNLIPTWSMVFIKDTGEIWHDGVYFGKPIKDQIAPIMSGTTKGIVFTPNGTDYYYKDFNLWGNTFDGDTKNINGDLVVQGVTYKWTYGDLGIKKGNTNLISFSNSANDYDVFIPNGDLLVTGGDINVNNGKVILDSTGYIKGTHILNTNSYFNADNTLGKTWSSIKQFNTSGTTISLDTTRPAIINIQEHAHASGTLWVPWIAGGDITELSSWGIGLGGDAFYIGRIDKSHTENSLSEYWKFDATDGITISGATKYIKVADLSGASEKVFMADGTVKALSDITSEAVIGEATTTNYGGFKLTQDKASSQQSLVANTTGNGRYAVKMNANGTLYVEFSQANTWLPATNNQEGYVPQLSGENDAIDSSLNDYVLTFTSSDAETIYPTWRRLPSNAFDNTWRGIYVDNTSKLGTGTTTKPINFKAGNGVTLTFTAAGDGTYNTLQIDGTTYSTATDSVLGLVKVGTTLDDVTGFTAVHIKDGVIYYKDTTYSFSNLKFQLTSGTDLMTYNSLAAKTILAGTGITFSYLNNVLTISSAIYSTATDAILGLVKIGTTLDNTDGYTKIHIDDNGFIYYHDTTYSFSKLKFQQTSGTDLMTYDSLATRTIVAGDNITFTHSSNVLTIKATDTTYSNFTVATSNTAGKAGLVPGPSAGQLGSSGYYLKADGSWAIPPDTWTAADNTNAGYVPKSIKGKYLHANDTTGALEWVDDRYAANTDKTGVKKGVAGATDINNGSVISVDSSTGITFEGGTNQFKVGNGTSSITIGVAHGLTDFKKSGANAASGLVPKPSTTAGTTKFLREDGTWEVPSYTSLPTFYNLVFNDGTNDILTYDPDGSASKKIIKGNNITFTVSGNNITIAATNTWTAMTGATASANGTVGYINATPPKDGYNTKFLRADGTWSVPAYPTKDSWNYDDRYLKLTGGTMTGSITMSLGTELMGPEGYHLVSWNHLENEDGYTSLGASNGWTLIRSTNTNLVHLKAGTKYDILDKSNSSASTSGQTITINLAGTSASLTNTWRGILDNLTSTSTEDSLSAKLGKVLKELIDGHDHKRIIPEKEDLTTADNIVGYDNLVYSKRIVDGATNLFNHTSGNNANTIIYIPTSSTTWGVQLGINANGTFFSRSYEQSSLLTWKLFAFISDIPTVNNGNLYLQANSTTVKTFTANQSGNTTLDIKIGSTNGTISVGGTDVSVKGLGSRAYDSTAYLPLTGGTMIGDIVMDGAEILNPDSAHIVAWYHPDNLSGYTSLGAYNGWTLIRSTDTDLVHLKNNIAYNILDSSNSEVSLSGSTLTVKINGTSKSLTNTWRGILNNLTSDSTTDSLSAAQGKALKSSLDTHEHKILLLYGESISADVDTLKADSFRYWNRVIDGTPNLFSHPSGNNANTVFYIPTSDMGAHGVLIGINFTGEIFSRYMQNKSFSGNSWRRLAFASEIPTKASWNYDDVYLKLIGGTMTGSITMSLGTEIMGPETYHLLAWYHPENLNGYTSIGASNGYTQIRSTNTDLLHLRAGTHYNILDTYNSEVSLSGSTLTVKINSTSKSLTNTWRGIQDNLTSSTNTTESLSAKQGYLLATGSARDSTKLPLTGGTMTGSISLDGSAEISTTNGWHLVSHNNNTYNSFGAPIYSTLIRSSGDNLTHLNYNTGVNYKIFDEGNSYWGTINSNSFTLTLGGISKTISFTSLSCFYDSRSSADEFVGYDDFRFSSRVVDGATGLFSHPSGNNANTILYIPTSGSVWGTLIGINSNGEIFTRPYSGSSLSGVSWNKVSFTSDLGSYLPLAGGTMTGSITLTNGAEILNKRGYHLLAWYDTYTSIADPSGTVTIRGNGVYSSNFYVNSDRNYKTNIQDITSKQKLHFRRFNWKESGKISFGLIALEALLVYPEIVSKNNEGRLSINYTAAFSLSISQLQLENDEMLNKVLYLETKVGKSEVTSDARKKQNISSFSEHIRKFQLKDTEKWHYGVIALEVPEMFREGEEGNMTVNYNSILSYYVGCLENRVKELEQKIKLLETK